MTYIINWIVADSDAEGLEDGISAQGQLGEVFLHETPAIAWQHCTGLNEKGHEIRKFCNCNLSSSGKIPVYIL